MENGFIIIVDKIRVTKINEIVIIVRDGKWGIIRISWILNKDTLILIRFKDDSIRKRKKIKRLNVLRLILKRRIIVKRYE